jgi:hypothetical protein
MSGRKKTAKLLLLSRYGYEEDDMFMLDDLGCLSHAFVEIDGSALYPVYFYSSGRLIYEMKTMSERGQSFVAQTGMIVLPQISIPAIEDAIQDLCDIGYFDYMTPMTLEQVESSDPKYWPPKLGDTGQS